MLQSARGLPLVRLFRSRRQLWRSDRFILQLFLCANVLLRPMGGSRGIVWMRDQTVLDWNSDVIWLVTVNGISWLAFWLKAETLAGRAHGVCSTCSAGRMLRKHRCLLDYHRSNQYVFVNAVDILAQILGERAVFPQFSLPHPATKLSLLRHVNYDDLCVAKEDQISQRVQINRADSFWAVSCLHVPAKLWRTHAESIKIVSVNNQFSKLVKELKFVHLIHTTNVFITC